MDISAVIKKLRSERGLTQQDNAEVVGVLKVAVGQWESEKSILRRENHEALSRRYGISIGELYGEQRVEYDNHPPSGSRRPVGRFGLVPMRRPGKTHANAALEKAEGEGMVEVLSHVAEMCPNGLVLSVEDNCMGRAYPDGCVVLVDPDAEAWNGCAVVTGTVPGESVLRRYMRGSGTPMLSPDSHNGEHEDMVFSDEDAQGGAHSVWLCGSERTTTSSRGGELHGADRLGAYS